VRREIATEAFLARLPLFAGLPPESLARLAAATERRRLKRGETLFREGEPSTGVHALVYGSIRLSMRAARGERVVDIVSPGQSFGEPVMFLEKPYIVGAAALADSLVLHVAKQAVFDELERSPALARRVIAALSQRVEGLVREVETYALGSAAKRFAAWLARRAPAGGGAASVMLPAAKRQLASRLNLSAEHLSRVLRELSSRGLIEVRGRELRVPDLERLRAWSARPEGAEKGS
jgi:CRP-like cAMP-binding protein